MGLSAVLGPALVEQRRVPWRRWIAKGAARVWIGDALGRCNDGGAAGYRNVRAIIAAESK